ncbi:hypothetical protein Q3G72_028297 [Acer saccharum]|nr:hypothetical protein Q3G72_028297 [Acer saccharum]
MACNRLANMLFDDDSDDEFQLLAIAVIEEEEGKANEGRTSGRRGSISGHAVIERDKVANLLSTYGKNMESKEKLLLQCHDIIALRARLAAGNRIG